MDEIAATLGFAVTNFSMTWREQLTGLERVPTFQVSEFTAQIKHMVCNHIRMTHT